MYSKTKKILLTQITFLIFGTTYANAEVQWIKPTESSCVSNGGIFNDGICEADWESSEKICESMNARLPLKSELEKVVKDCGAVDFYMNNMINSKYRSCYEKKGFSGERYWSSDDLYNEKALAWFSGGQINHQNVYMSAYSFCIKK